MPVWEVPFSNLGLQARVSYCYFSFLFYVLRVLEIFVYVCMYVCMYVCVFVPVCFSPLSNLGTRGWNFGKFDGNALLLEVLISPVHLRPCYSDFLGGVGGRWRFPICGRSSQGKHIDNVKNISVLSPSAGHSVFCVQFMTILESDLRAHTTSWNAKESFSLA